ncbi:MAG: nitrate/sulfonate/bicarbonate ABC transporter ATP-binding protein [Oligoflexia bacterium]|nr:nitrate/sulfonate/bicarbonate ABC transporter ATP-binding protein [Oligoflexia bacterium]
MATPFIELKNVSKNFVLESGTEIRVLKDINLSLDQENLIAILGPSGSGKSTCLRVMCGLLKPDSGDVLSNGKPLEGTNYDVALVFQSFALFPWETVYNNIELALSPLKLPEREARARVKKAIDLVGLEGFEEAYPRELAGGMKQRVGIARALVMERPILFLDEPFSSLDILTADTMRWEMVNIWQSKNTAVRTMVLVTHNIQEAVYMAKRILIMGSNPGHIRAELVNDLAYPRDENGPAFRRMVSRIHELIAESVIPDMTTPSAYTATSMIPKVVREPPIETIPNVQIGAVIGLVEAITDQGGTADIFELGPKIGKDYGTTLYMVKAAELLDLVDTPKHMVILTDLGRRFVDGDINVRKRVLHELFGALKIVQLTTNLLRIEETLRIQIETLTERVSEWLPNENPHQIVETLVSWGRFAEYFGYNDDTKEVYLDVGQETL